MGLQTGRKVLTVQTIPAWQERDYGTGQLGRVGGFSLHAGVAVNTRGRKKLERIGLGGPAGISLGQRYRQTRLELRNQGMVSCASKTAYLRGPIGMGLLGGNPTRVVRAGRPCAAGFHGQTGSTGAQASDEPNGAAFMPLGAGTISWSAVTGRPSVEQWVPRERDSAKCSQGRACQH